MSRSYQSYLIESLNDRQEAAAYLEAVLEDGNAEEVRLALSHVAAAQMAENPASEHIYVETTELDITSLIQLLKQLGFKLSVAPKEHVA